MRRRGARRAAPRRGAGDRERGRDPDRCDRPVPSSSRDRDPLSSRAGTAGRGSALRPRAVARAPSTDFSTMAWKTEANWAEEVRRRPDDMADAVLRLEDIAAEAGRRLEDIAGRLESGGGPLYERVRSTIRRPAVGND